MLKQKTVIDRAAIKLGSAWKVETEGEVRHGLVMEVDEGRIHFMFRLEGGGTRNESFSVGQLMQNKVKLYSMCATDTPMGEETPKEGTYADIMQLRGEAFPYAVDNHMPIGDILLSRETMIAVLSAYEKRGRANETE